MTHRQQTLRKTYCFEGKGLHTGTYCHLRLLPAPEGTGIHFCRTDLRTRPVIPALAENVSATARSTTLSRDEAVAVTVEHLLSALTGLGVDNALVEMDNIEVPIQDGSARPFAEAILRDGLRRQEAPRRYVDLPEAVEVRDDAHGGWIRIEPAEEPSVDVTVDFQSRVLGVQTVHWDPSMDYAREIAPCRTFVFFHEIEYLFRNNLIKGGDVENAIVIVEHPVSGDQLERLSRLFGIPGLRITEAGYLNNLRLHFPDECGRHKLLDLLGDLRLTGGFLKARVTAYKPGHTLNTRAAKAVTDLLNSQK